MIITGEYKVQMRMRTIVSLCHMLKSWQWRWTPGNVRIVQNEWEPYMSDALHETSISTEYTA